MERLYFLQHLREIADGPVSAASLSPADRAVPAEILSDRSDLMLKRAAEFAQQVPVSEIDLGSDARLPSDDVAGCAPGKSYTLATLPPGEPKCAVI